MPSAWSSTASWSSAAHTTSGVGDPVVAEDPDRDPEQVVSIRFTLPPVPRVQPRCQRQRVVSPGVIGSRELRDLDQQSFAQAGFAVH
jgi:hypothetical protein